MNHSIILMKPLFLLSLFMVFVIITLSASPLFIVGSNDNEAIDITSGENSDDEIPITSIRGTDRFLRQKPTPPPRGMSTCDKYPKVCHVKGSPGHHCCYKKCVDKNTDRLNCGKCGKKCKYSEICCKAKCVNPMFHNKHCGGCFNKCKKRCTYGICDYSSS